MSSETRPKTPNPKKVKGHYVGGYVREYYRGY